MTNDCAGAPPRVSNDRSIEKAPRPEREVKNLHRPKIEPQAKLAQRHFVLTSAREFRAQVPIHFVNARICSQRIVIGIPAKCQMTGLALPATPGIEFQA